MCSENIFSIYFFAEISRKDEKSEAVSKRCSVKRAFLKISQNSQENICARVSF